MPENQPDAAPTGVIAAVRDALSIETANALVLIDQDARTLIEAAAGLADAETPEVLGQALIHNLQVWLAIKTLANAEGSTLPDGIRRNLDLLAAFVIRTTLEAQQGRITTGVIQTMAEINLAIADGLRLSQQNWLIRDRAYQLWEEAGRSHAGYQEHLAQAEQEIIALLTAG